jgi:aminoglycoside phosphotransferase (APT) family kinase protein
VISTIDSRSDRSPPLSLSRDYRRRIFYLKTDLDVPDARLRSLRPEVEHQLQTRLPEIFALLSRLGIDGIAQPMTTGTFRLIYRIMPREGPSVILRTPVSGLFERDRGLAIDGRVRKWLKPAHREYLVPDTIDVRFANDGAPFDYAIQAEAPGRVLRDLGDQILDERPEILTNIGRVLRAIHGINAIGAGLLDLEDSSDEAPNGLHPAWLDYLVLNLDKHISFCRGLGLIDDRMARKIESLFETMTPALEGRPSRLLHGDPGIHNICVDEENEITTCVLDWEDAMAGDPLFDVAMFSTFHPSRRMQSFFEGYGMMEPTDVEQRLLALYFLRIALAKSVHRARFGIADRPDRAPAHERIFRGVADLERLI